MDTDMKTGDDDKYSSSKKDDRDKDRDRDRGRDSGNAQQSFPPLTFRLALSQRLLTFT
jgi:hypothetical protein